MQTYIIILRGINVSGKNKLPMKDLQLLLQKLGYTDIQTYIQSGNVVLQTEELKEEVVSNIEEAITKTFGYEVPILIRTVAEWEKAIANNPYKDVEEKQQYFTFLSTIPSEKTIEVDAKNDEFTILEDVVYINAVGGYGKTKLTNNFIENKLKVIATTRNLKTTLKLLEMAKK